MTTAAGLRPGPGKLLRTVLAFLAGLGINASGAEGTGDRLAVMAERDLPGGREQRALRFEGDDVSLTQNSNFFEAAAAGPVRLGFFRASASAVLKSRADQLRLIAARMTARRDLDLARQLTDPNRSPHGTRIYLNDREQELRSSTRSYEAATNLLERAWSLADWKSVDAVAVSWKSERSLELVFSGKRTETRAVTPEAAHCTKGEGHTLVCAIDGYGTAYLRR